MAAQMKALWASSMQEGQNLLVNGLKPTLIVGALTGALGLFTGFGALGISQQYLYGAIGGIGGMPHDAMLVFCRGLPRAVRVGQEVWEREVAELRADPRGRLRRRDGTGRHAEHRAQLPLDFHRHEILK